LDTANLLKRFGKGWQLSTERRNKAVHLPSQQD
jgi:hypothetical protein